MQFGDSIWKHARWTRMFQTANDLTTVKCGATTRHVGGNNPGDMRAMPVIIHAVGCIFPSPRIVTADHFRGQVGMRVINAGIEHGNPYAFPCGPSDILEIYLAQIPRLLRDWRIGGGNEGSLN